jgi:hypothetical protein
MATVRHRLPDLGDWCSPRYVRFAPESGQTASVSQCPLCAKSGLYALQQKTPYSITSSARSRNDSGIAKRLVGAGVRKRWNLDNIERVEFDVEMYGIRVGGSIRCRHRFFPFMAWKAI